MLMLEESFKAIEGLVTHRQATERAELKPGAVYSATNRAYERGVSAAAEVLYLDAMVCEDAILHALPICRVLSDFESFLPNRIARSGRRAPG